MATSTAGAEAADADILVLSETGTEAQPTSPEDKLAEAMASVAAGMAPGHTESAVVDMSILIYQ